MTWPPRTGVDFVTWMDAECGAERRAFLEECYAASSLGASAVWSLVLVHAWRVGATFAWFESRSHFDNWLRGRIRWARRIERLNERRHWERCGWVALSGSEPCRLMDALRAGQALRPAEAKMAAALESLSAKRRAAVECIVVGEMRPRDACELLGCRQNTLAGNVAQGLDELRRRYDGTYVSRAESIRRAMTRRASA